jgi:signal transduction histidine kinase
VIRAHGGDITLRNHPDGGLEVQVRLPLQLPLQLP